jgi:acetyl esterase/lipase
MLRLRKSHLNHMKNRKLFTLFIVCVGVFIGSCSKDAGEKLEEQKFYDVSYGQDARHKMDVYLPEGRDVQTPVVILIHGGAWTSGEKGDMSFIQDLLHANRFNTININYRFASIAVDFEAMLDDVNAAIQMVRSKSGEWGIRDQKFVLLGASSGAHLAMLQAYGRQQPSSVIGSVVSIAGPTDLTTLTTDPGLNFLISTVLVRASLQQGFADPRFKLASPIHQVDQAVPTLLIHGTVDDIVPYTQSVELQQQLSNKKVVNKLVTLEGVAHELDVDFATTARVLGELRTWIRAHGR